MELPAELIEIILAHVDKFTRLKFLSTQKRFNPGRRALYHELLPLVYNSRKYHVDFCRALRAKHEDGIRFMLEYVDPEIGLIHALEYKHDLSINYLIREANILGTIFEWDVIYYAYKAHREDILNYIQLRDEKFAPVSC